MTVGKVTPVPLREANPVTPSRYLVVSNAPETITPDTWNGDTNPVGQLYRCRIPLPASGELPVRVFLWHKNEIGAIKTIWIALRMGSGSAQLIDHRALAPDYGQEYDRGMCLAKAQLFGTIEETGYHTATEITATSDVGLGNYEVKNGEMVTAIHEFTVKGSPGQVLDLRTIITDGTNYGQPYNKCLKPRHIRGWWPFSELLATAEDWDVGASLLEPGNQHHIPLCEKGGKDQEVFRWQGPEVDPFGHPQDSPSGNRGLFGVNARYRIRLRNTADHKRYVSFHLRARETGGAYFGAALALEEDEIKTLGGVPRIRHETTQPPNTINAVRIRRSDLPILPNTSAPCTIQNATAGGARMPVDLRLVASPVATPINEGGP
jgi:hypothetical protein